MVGTTAPPLQVWLAIGAVAAVGLVLALFASLASSGPTKVTTSVRRYGYWPWLLTFALAAGLLVWIVSPVWRTDLAVLGLFSIVGWIWVALRYDLGRRMILRARWPSVARSCGLGVRRDVRGRQWPFDTTTTVLAERVESLPVISHPRRVGKLGVRYRLTPARGSTLRAVADESEALAAGLNVARVVVDRSKPGRGQLLVLWGAR